ncbi:hypothetical protein NZNM25_12560 [Nitrosopumilus zosterae]|uniref:DUF922 domain-containing protein n=1 Tax=Nitrosopumilus zosterae TaxID=718286 RepID=A0A2S2KSN0_9ARCH|nr:hypothetical protein [Nitrosopumilus zosterae]BDQ30921.1 hypothetical protein NZOSNM25_001029 [Nitrosopumilus zosterae]GBH34465.1 hypothetical protein NZNM25_12560 [Nitrosopumilus zosterae]
MNENDVVVWSKETFLKWADFQAESNPATFEDSHSVIKYKFTWTINSEKIDEQILFLIENIRIYVEFFPHLSWVRISQDTDRLLNHEQGHFDLAEMIRQEYIEKLQAVFYGKHFPTRGQNEEQQKQFAKEDSGRMIAEEIEKLEQVLVKRRQEYDAMTEFGHNLEKQLEFDLKFNKLRS